MPKKILLLIAVFFLIPKLALAETISSTTLIEKASAFDNKTVVFKGEVVGELLTKGDFTWLNINDDPYSMSKKGNYGFNTGQSVWISSKLVKNIKRSGGYFWNGDIVLVRGTFNRVCNLHGGDIDIHAKTIKIIGQGKPIKHSLSNVKLFSIFILLLIIIFLLQIVKSYRHRQLA